MSPPRRGPLGRTRVVARAVGRGRRPPRAPPRDAGRGPPPPPWTFLVLRARACRHSVKPAMNRGHEVLAEGSEAVGERTFGVAHGLALNINRPLRGLPPHVCAGAPEVIVDVGPDHDLLAGWPDTFRARRRTLRADGRGVLVERDPRDPRGAHRLSAPGCATAVIDTEARRIAIAPNGDAGGDGWSRMLAARALPYAALIHGYEVL